MPTKTVRMAVLTTGIDSAISGMSKLGAGKDKLTGDAVVKVALVGGDITQEKLAALEAEIKAITDKGATVRVNMTGSSGDIAKVTAESDALAAAGARVSTTLEEEGTKAGGFGSKLKGLLLPGLIGVGAAMGYGVVKAVGFNAIMERVHTQAGLSTAQLKTMTPQILALAGQVGENPDSLAESFYHVASNMASLGGTGPQMLNAVKIAAEGARVGGADLVDVTNALGAAIASGIPGVQNYQSAMGMLNATVGAGDMQMQDLAEALGTGFLSNVKIYGSTLNDVGSILATFGDNNIRGAEAGTQLRVSVQSIAVQAKTAGPVLKELGLGVGELGKYQSIHGTVATINLLVERMKAAGISSTETGNTVTQLFGKKAGAGIAVLIDQVARLDSKQKVLADGAKGFGKAWDDTKKTAAQQFADLKAGTDALAIQLGLKLLPAAIDVMKGLNSFMGVLQKNAAVAGTLGAILGTVLAGLALKKLEEGLKGAVDGFEALYGAGKKVVVFAVEMAGKLFGLSAASTAATAATEGETVAQEGLNLAFLANPIVLVIVGIAALVVAFVELWQHSAAFRDFWKVVWHDILIAVDFAFTWVKQNWPLLGAILIGPIAVAALEIYKHWSYIVTGAKIAFSGLRAAFQPFIDAYNWVIGTFDRIKNYITTSFDSWWAGNGEQIKEIWHAVWSAITTVFKAEWTVITTVARGYWTILSDLATVGWAALRIVFGAGLSFLKSVWSFGWSAMTMVTRVAWTIISTVVKAGWILVGTVLKAGWIVIETLFDIGWSIVTSAWRISWGIITAICRTAWDLIATVLKVGWDIIVGIFTVAINLLTGHWSLAWNAVRTTLQQVWNAIKVFLGQALNNLTGAVFNALAVVVAFFRGLSSRILGALGNLGRLLLNSGVSLITGLFNGITSALSSVASWVKNNIFSPIINAVKSAFGIRSPSTVMSGIGGHLIGGLILGMLRANPVSMVKDIFGGLPSALGYLVEKGMISVANLPAKAVSALRGLGGKFLNLIGGTASTLWNDIFGSSGGGAGGFSASAMQAQAYAQGQLSRYGWGQNEMPALIRLWNQESGWNANARNASSGAAGIPQDISGNMHGGYIGQINWGLAYIKGRYGSPDAAWAHEVAMNWYDHGGLLMPGLTLAVNNTGHPEMVVPAGGTGQPVVVNVYCHPSNRPDETAKEIWQMLRVLRTHLGNKPLGLG